MKLPVKFKLSNLTDLIRMNENEPGKKNDKYFQKNKDGKLLLRKAMAKYIPNEITNADKQGFSAPDASWFKGESIEYVKKIIYDKKSNIYNFFDKKSVINLVEEHLNGLQNRRLFIWSLLNFENWIKYYS